MSKKVNLGQNGVKIRAFRGVFGGFGMILNAFGSFLGCF
jgi:hypothetical protein